MDTSDDDQHDVKKRRTGVPFEQHANKLLAEMASDPEPDGPLEEAISGSTVYAPWADVPAEKLVEIGWDARDEAERRRIYEGPQEKRGFREYGGDALIERRDTGMMLVQHKDHAHLETSCLGRFYDVADAVHELNVSKGLSAPSALLCFPEEARVSARDLRFLQARRERTGLFTLAVQGFRPEGHADGVSMKAVAKTRLPTVFEENDEVYKACIPTNGNFRSFQRKTANAINRDPGLHLVRAPPGCGKTAIVANVVGLKIGKLSGNQRDLRSGALPAVAFLTAPYIDHVKQLADRLECVLGRKPVVVADNDVQSKESLLAKMSNGDRVFVSTDQSAHLLVALAEQASEEGRLILTVKDEAHYNSSHLSASTQLLLIAAQHGTAVACTATPDSDVMSLPGLKRTLEMSIDQAVKKGFCAPYQIVLPDIVTAADGLPTEASSLAGASLGCAALFGVGGMLRDGQRRCVAYARDKEEAQQLQEMLKKACDFHGVLCESQVVVENTKSRGAIYNAFLTRQTSQKAVLEGAEGTRPVLLFLIGVAILDACVDLPQCDSILIASPPTSYSNAESAHRAIQRLGRALRPTGRTARAYIFSDLGSAWLQTFFDTLHEFDPGCTKNVCVRSTDVARMYTRGVAEEEKVLFENIVEKFDIGFVSRQTGMSRAHQRALRMLKEYKQEKKHLRVEQTEKWEMDGKVENIGWIVNCIRRGQ